nr:unnamed protein product [Callosobruchus analis]
MDTLPYDGLPLSFFAELIASQTFCSHGSISLIRRILLAEYLPRRVTFTVDNSSAVKPMDPNFVFASTLKHSAEGIKINKEVLNNIRYANDTVIIADSQENLQILINKLVDEGNAWGLRINTKKTKVMIIPFLKNDHLPNTELSGVAIYVNELPIKGKYELLVLPPFQLSLEGNCSLR